MTLIKGRYKGADGEQQIPIKVDHNGQIMVEVNDIELTAIVTDLDIMADWDENDRCKVNLIPGQAGVSAAAGAVAANTPRITLASNDPAVTSLAVLDDWDSNDRCKVSPIAGQDGIASGAGAVGATVPRVTHASDDPVVTSVQIMDDWDSNDRCKVSPIAGQDGLSAGSGNIDAGTQRVTLATDGVVGQCQNTDDSGIGTKGLSVVAKAKTSQRAAVADGDAVQPIANEYGELIISGHTWATRSIRIEEIDPLDQKFVGETIAAVTNQAAGTYNYYIDMAGYTSIGFQWVLSFTAGSTIKVYGTLQDDGTAPASCTYSDLTTALWGAATITATGTNFDSTGTLGLCKYVKVEVVIGAGGGGADDYTIYAKRAW